MKIQTKLSIMKKIILLIITVSVFSSCTSDDAFKKGKAQLEQQGYTNIHNTGYEYFCCSKDDTFSTGFSAIDRKGQYVKGCFCSGILKGVTIRFE